MALVMLVAPAGCGPPSFRDGRCRHLVSAASRERVRCYGLNLACLLLALLSGAKVADAAFSSSAKKSDQCGGSGSSAAGSCLDCGLWLAESLVSPGSLGLFVGHDHGATRKNLDDEDDEDDDADQTWELPFEDVAISLVDYASPNATTSFPLGGLLWNAYHTYSSFDADQVDAVLPGIGTLVQTFAGEGGGISALVKLELDHEGLDRARIGAGNASAGAFSHVQSVRFMASSESESKTCPVSLGQELVMDPKQRLGPDRYDQQREGRETKKKSGNKTVKSSGARSPSWLQQNAICLDHLKAGMSIAVPHQRGAFAKRPLSKGQRVTAFPVVALDRKQLKIRRNSSEGEDEASQYDQLLLNYAYGHADSSLLLFPLGPAVNLVNHPNQGKEANVALKWYSGGLISSAPAGFHLEKLLDALPSQVLQRQGEQMKEQPSSGTVLMMELYALSDLEPDDELLLHYGFEWETAWDRHQLDWNLTRMTNSQSTSPRPAKSAYEYEQDDEIYTRDEPRQYPPDSIQPRCYVDVDKLSRVDDEGWYDFAATSGDLIDWTQPCDILSAKFDLDGDKDSYRVIVSVNHDSTTVEYQVKNVPWSAITFVDQSYQGLQYHHQAFRHEIQLPDDVFPPAWKDMAASLSDETCGLYMAESAIPNSGMGMYSARSIAEGERIFYGDVVIQVEDYEFNQRLRRAYHGVNNESKAPWLLNSYYWDPSVSLAQTEASDVQSIVPGLGMLANSHTGLVNAAQMEPHQRDYHLHRAIDVGAGASSSYHDVHFDAEKDIQVGEEIFVRYGDAWFVERLESVPLQADFVKADILLHRFWGLVRGTSLRQTNDKLAGDVWDLVINLTKARDRLASALPSFPDVEKVVRTGTASYSTPERFRSRDWLEQNGRCLDNLRPGDSMARQAGKGAFATRRITAGDVIAPMPLVQILRRDLEVYEATESIDDADGPLDPKNIRYLGTQQLLNYCYGHKDSSLLLFPYSPVVNYVNHHSSTPNAKLRWSSLSSHRADWLRRSPIELAQEPHAGLIMELVAVRDILPGEEVFLDYGTDWNERWRDFRLDWYPPENGTSYVSASTLNRRNEWLRTEQEQVSDPYPYRNVFTMCYVGKDRTPFQDGSFDEDDAVYEWTHTEGIYDDTSNLFPCQVLERDIGDHDLSEVLGRRESIHPLEILYTVRVMEDEDDPEELMYFVSVPREAIVFFDHPYTTDLFLRQAFRHEIHLPDEMVPSEWRDLVRF